MTTSGQAEGENVPVDDSFCLLCVYAAGRLDPAAISVPDGPCGLSFTPGDEFCLDMRTANCGIRRR
ncbi:MAG: hypothetical protein HZA20_10745 [Nitrospirae bacterium]|nr:hypothetical protein [Nitrospirota bacterium]